MNLERRVRMRNGFLAITAIKSERDGPNANNVYPIPAATVIFIWVDYSTELSGNIVKSFSNISFYAQDMSDLHKKIYPFNKFSPDQPIVMHSAKLT